MAEPERRGGGQARHRGEAARPPRVPAGATRDRILDAALDLFVEQGYDKTSLREIADQLGFTKAALYYHFQRKEEILLALHLRLHALGRDLLEGLESLEDTAAALQLWPGMLDEFIDQVLANRKLFLLHARNENALREMDDGGHNDSQHKDMGEQLTAFLGNRALPVELRVRLACSLGAAMGAIMGAGESFTDVAPEELSRLVRGVVHELLLPLSPGGHRGVSKARPRSSGQRRRPPR